MTTSATSHRKFAIAATDGTCPRCGAARSVDQNYCLECGDALPVVSGRLAAARRRWLARIGWYPGDWMWVSLGTLVVAAAGAAVAIAVSQHRDNTHRGFETVAGGVALRVPAVEVPTGQTPTTKVDTSKLPTAPEPGSPAAGNGRTVWPRERDRLDDRARLLPEDVRAPAGAGHRDQGGEEGAAPGRGRRLERATRASSPATTSSSPGSTAHGRRRTPPSAPPARRASRARTPVRSPADRRGVALRPRRVRSLSERQSVYRSGDICNSTLDRVKSSRKPSGWKRFTAS